MLVVFQQFLDKIFFDLLLLLQFVFDSEKLLLPGKVMPTLCLGQEVQEQAVMEALSQL
jgi:hypothetical protein